MISYLLDPNRPMIYSVGENGVDDGGSLEPMRPEWIDASGWRGKDYVIDLERQPRRERIKMDDGVGGLSTRPASNGGAITEPSTQAGP